MLTEKINGLELELDSDLNPRRARKSSGKTFPVSSIFSLSTLFRLPSLRRTWICLSVSLALFQTHTCLTCLTCKSD